MYVMLCYVMHCLPRESDSKTTAVVEQSDKHQFTTIKFGTHL